MTEFTRDWTQNYTEHWMASLSHLIGAHAVRGLEIGCFEGRSSCWFADNILTGQGSRLDCVDPWLSNGADIESRFDNNVDRHRDRIRKHCTASFDWLVQQNATESPCQYDFIYVDGDHRAKAVLSDLILCWPLLRPGGVLICDDYLFDEYDPAPKVAIDAFMQCHTDWKPLHQGYQVILRKAVGIEAVVVSVDYSDYLAHTLPSLARWVDRVIVVSHKADKNTAEVVKQNPFAELVTTDAFTRNGDRFNKGAAINVGLRRVDKDGWILLVDADIAITHPIQLPERKQCIYGALRKRVRSITELAAFNAGEQFDLPIIPPVQLRDGYAPSGYFQLWHGKTSHRLMPESSRDASRSDIEFARNWRVQDRRMLNDFEVLHLESPGSYRGANWQGRVTPSFETSSDEQARSSVSTAPKSAGNLTQGILTAANAKYWPVLRLLSQATRGAGYPLAVVDHGLTPRQRRWLEQEGVQLHEVPDPKGFELLQKGGQSVEPPSAPQAWLKPWICVNSPFQQTIWIDADAVPLRGLNRMFSLLERGAWLTLESWVSSDSAKRLYRPMITEALGGIPRRFDIAHRINTGVFGFRREDSWVQMWWQMCQRILGNEKLLNVCRLRDQAALVTLLCAAGSDVDLPRIQLDRSLNWPVNGVRSVNRDQRVQYPWRDETLLAVLRRDHPSASVIHWLGAPKPWQMH